MRDYYKERRIAETLVRERERERERVKREREIERDKETRPINYYKSTITFSPPDKKFEEKTPRQARELYLT